MRAGGLVIVAVWLGGCAGPSLLLLPDEAGGQGSVAVLEAGGKPQETVVAQGNTRTRLGARPATRTVPPGRLSAAERALLGDLPPPAATFVLYFEEGTSRLTPESRPQLDALRAEVARRSGVEVQVTGHTDTLGSDEDNDRLSEKRAQEILGVLSEEGIARQVMTAVGRGEREPRVRTGDGVRNAANRRVEVTVR